MRYVRTPVIHYFTVALSCTALAAGCKGSKKQAEPDPAPARGAADTVTGGGSDEGMIVQPRFSVGEEAPTDEGTIPFTITKVTPGQKPSSTAPFHEAGGDWTYVEAHLDGDPAATFVVGIPTLPRTRGGPGFGKLMFAPTTSAAGGRVVTRLAAVLGTTAPPPRAGGVLRAANVPIAVLGQGIGRLDNGLGGEGTWDATKLFCSAGDVESAELFMNLSLAEKKGEFSEKDTDYNKDVVACLATILRDGFPPPRTAANDPTLATSGPRLELGKKIGGRRMQRLAVTPTRMLMLDERGDRATLVEVDVKTGTAKDLYSTPDRLDGGDCDATLTRCVIKASTPAGDRNTYANDPSRLLWFEGAKVTPLEAGSLTSSSLASAGLSPDARFVVVHDYTAKPKRLVALDRSTSKTFVFPGAEKGYLDVVAWDGTTAIVVNHRYDDDATDTVSEWKLGAKGAIQPSKRTATAPLMSPDGKRRVSFADGTLTLTTGGAPRTLVLHPDDARSVGDECCTWIDNRWLTTRTGFIDTDAMKVSLLPVEEGADAPRAEYIAGSRVALVWRDDGVYLATVAGP